MRHWNQTTIRRAEGLAVAIRARLREQLSARRLRADNRGQDLIEYALLCGFMVIAVYVILPADLMPAVSNIFSRVTSVASTLTGS